MSLQIICEFCTGELQVPDSSAGKDVRCPFCARVFVCPIAFSDDPEPAVPLDDSTVWTPHLEEQLDSSLPRSLLLASFAPAALLAFVTIEPIALTIVGVLVVLSLILASRRSWSWGTRFSGIVSLASLGYAAAALAHLHGQGSFPGLMTSTPAAIVPTGPDLADADWKPQDLTDINVRLLVPGSFTRRTIGEERHGIDVFVRESRFPRQHVTFAFFDFTITPTPVGESDEFPAMQKMDDVIRWGIFFDGELEQTRRIYYQEHPGIEYLFTVRGKTTRCLCRAYLIRDHAYLIAVSADNYDANKTLADKFLDSFQLIQPKAGLRTATPEPDWKALGREPIPRPTPVGTYRGHARPPIIDLAFSADGKSLVTGSGREHIVLWNLATGHGGVLIGTEASTYFAVDPRRKLLAVLLPANIIATEQVQFAKLGEQTPELADANTDAFGFVPDGRTVVAASGSQFAGWDSVDGKELWQRNTNAALASIALSRDGRLVATAFVDDADIKLWNVVKKGGDVASWTAHASAPKGLAIQQMTFSSDGRFLASAGLDGAVKIWSLADVNQPKLAANLLHENPVSCAAYSNDGKTLATGDYYGVVRLWDPAKATLRSEFRAAAARQPVQFLRFSPDDARLAAAVDLGIDRAGVNLYDVAKLPVAAEGPSVGFPQSDEPPLIRDSK